MPEMSISPLDLSEINRDPDGRAIAVPGVGTYPENPLPYGPRRSNGPSGSERDPGVDFIERQ
jgi:hypothetical protein